MGPNSRKYKGWIPTVSGRLSFEVIGTGSHPNPPNSMNVADRKTRYVLCEQQRVLLDNAIIFKEKAARHLYDEIGKFIFVCAGKSANDPMDRDASLEGLLYIYEVEVWREAICDTFTRYQNSLLSYWNQLGPLNLADYFQEKFDELQQLLKKHCYFYVPYKLHRSGITELTVTDDCAENIGSPDIKADDNPHIEHSVCSQTFFFMKDILHNHQHHDPYTDTLSDVYLVVNDDDEYSWRCETIRLLYRMILTYKRNRKEEICNSALGIIAYVKSFKEISAIDLTSNSVYATHNNKLQPDLSDALLTESIKASQDSLRNYLQEKIRKSDKLTNVILATLTIILSIIGILQITQINYKQEDVSIFFIFLSWIVLTQPLLCLAGVGLVAFFFAEKMGVISFKRRLDLYRVIVTQEQKKMEYMFSTIGVLLFIVTIILVSYLDEVVLWLNKIV